MRSAATPPKSWCPALSPPNSRSGKKRGRDKHGPSLGRKRPRRAYSKQRGHRGDVCCPQRMVHLRRESKSEKEPLIHAAYVALQMCCRCVFSATHKILGGWFAAHAML